MGARLRSTVATLAVAVLLAISTTSEAASFSACWVERQVDILGRTEQVTRCRIAGGTTIDYASDTDVPGKLYPATGTDVTGQCWYYTSAVTPYVILAQYANGDADIGYDTDPSNPGGIVAIGPTLPRCTSEPIPAADPLVDVWEYVTQYIHSPPQPDLSPPAGSGVTGMDTYVGVPIPSTHTTTLASGGTSLDIYIEVSAVVVDWGDGAVESFPPSDAMLAGYPDGLVTHIYETKSDEMQLSISYDWTARWRVSGGAWDFLSVPDTTTTTAYPLAEIVSDLTG